jgi:hypothetical protein
MSPGLPEYLAQLPAGWRATDPTTSANLERELAAELCEGHPLQGVRLRVVSDTNGITDGILCSHCDEPSRFTVVHLSWRGSQEPVPDHPWIEIDGDFTAFLRYVKGTYPPD